MDTSEFANLVGHLAKLEAVRLLIDLKIFTVPYPNLDQQIQLTKDRIQEMVGSR